MSPYDEPNHDPIWESLQSGAPVYDSVQLVQITPITMVFGTYNNYS